jgi:AhpD family alkylhydroperoxidase
MPARMKNPAVVIPEAMKAIQALNAAVSKGGAPTKTLELAHLRASQINGCSACVDGGVRHAITVAERAALALTEAVTRLSDRADPVPDAIWEDAAKHFDERALAALILSIAATNVFNRLNVSTRQPAGAWG